MVNVFRYPYINIIWFCMHWLAMSNSCYNPFIYLLLNVSLFIRSRLSIVKCYLIKIKFVPGQIPKGAAAETCVLLQTQPVSGK